jgi:acyl-CoA synthetase (AMP-forming)/AMP-acid ligase II
VQLPDLDYPPTMPAAVRRAAELFGDRPFIVMPDRRMSFRQAEAASRRLAATLLATGVGKGTRVGVMFGYGADWVVTWLAVTRIGALFMPFSTAYKPAELRKVLQLGDVERLLVPPQLNGSNHLDFLEEAVPGLATAGLDPLWLTDLPYLRSVWVAGGGSRPWAHPVTVDFRSDGSSDPAVPDELLRAAEAQVTPADWMLVVFTSGTTAMPKAVVHTHGNFLRHGANLARFIGFDTETKSFCGMPFFWIGGVGLGLNMAFAGGSTILCVERFDPDAALDLMEAEGANHVGMWLQLAQRLRQHITATGRDVSRIPALAPPPPGVPFTTDVELRHNSLGMTETVGPHSAGGPEGDRVLPEEMRGSFGLLVPNVEHRIADPETNATLGEGQEGEVCIRGYSLMAGLYKKERHETFDEGGWYHTGDRGVIRDGYLYFRGRLSEMIKTSGSNVAPREVELALEAFEEVGMAVVVGLPDPDRGEVVAVAMAPTPGGAIDAEDVLQRLDKEVSSYKVPRRVMVMAEDEVPYLPSGKPDRIGITKLLETSSVEFRPGQRR